MNAYIGNQVQNKSGFIHLIYYEKLYCFCRKGIRNMSGCLMPLFFIWHWKTVWLMCYFESSLCHSWLSHYSLEGRMSTPEYVTRPRKEELPCTLGKSSFYFPSPQGPPIFRSTIASLVHSVCSLPHWLLGSISESEQQILPLSFGLPSSSVSLAWAPVTVLPQNVVTSVTCLMEVLK